MSFKKIAPMVAVTGAAVMAVAAPAMSASAQTNEPVAKVAAAPAAKNVGIQANKKFACAKPKGKKLSVTFTNGNISYKIFFNNHCSAKRHIRIWRKDGSGWKGKGRCITVNPHTKGNKKITDPGFSVYNVTSPKKC